MGLEDRFPGRRGKRPPRRLERHENGVGLFEQLGTHLDLVLRH